MMVHWYKRDPDAALAGMMALTFEERGFYNTILDLLYARDGNLIASDDEVMARMLQCDPRTWRRLRDRLIQLGKIRINSQGSLTGNRVELCLRESQTFSERQAKRARSKWKKIQNPNEINCNVLPLAAMPRGNASTTTTTTEEVRSKELLTSSSTERLSLGLNSERDVSGSGGSLASLGTTLASPPPPAPPPLTDSPKQDSKQAATEQEPSASPQPVESREIPASVVAYIAERKPDPGDFAARWAKDPRNHIELEQTIPISPELKAQRQGS